MARVKGRLIVKGRISGRAEGSVRSVTGMTGGRAEGSVRSVTVTWGGQDQPT